MKFSLRYFALTFALVTLLCACGQKGRLMMPVRPPAVSTPYPVAQPKPADTPDETDDKPAPATDKADPEKN